MSKKFQPLDYSRGWDDYWRDHPQGYSPQEQMINWSGQLNAMVDFFNEYFDVDLTEYATDVMEGWYFDGRLEDIINEALFNSKADKTTVASQLADILSYVDKNKPTPVIQKIHDLLRSQNATYIMIGDSTRASNGAYVYNVVSKSLQGLGVATQLSAQSGLKAEHWGANVNTLQPNYPQAVDIIPLIPDDGSKTIIDICLGLNDVAEHTVAEVKGYILNGINLIKTQKPNVTINLTSPNLWDSGHAYKLPIVYSELSKENNFGYINVYENVFKTVADMDGYFIAGGHPNKEGQLKVANYILDKLIPEDLKIAEGVRVLKGRLSTNEINDYIRASGIRLEVKYIEGVSTGDIYLRKLATDNNWYIYDVNAGNSLSTPITMVNGEQLVKGKGFVTGKEIEAMVYIDDVTPLLNYDTTQTIRYFPFINGVVSEFTPIKTQKQALTELSGVLTTEWNYVDTFMNGWVNSFPTDDNLKTKFKKVGDVVYLEFYLIDGTKGQPAFTLPEGYRPRFSFKKIFEMYEDEGDTTAFHRIEVKIGGDVIVSSNRAANTHMFGVISFTV